MWVKNRRDICQLQIELCRVWEAGATLQRFTHLDGIINVLGHFQKHWFTYW